MLLLTAVEDKPRDGPDGGMRHHYLRLQSTKVSFQRGWERRKERGKIFKKKHNLLQARTIPRHNAFSCLIGEEGFTTRHTLLPRAE